jgi:hypothetical protein
LRWSKIEIKELDVVDGGKDIKVLHYIDGIEIEQTHS